LGVVFKISKGTPPRGPEGGGGKWGHAPSSASLGGASTHVIQTFKERVFQQKFRPK